MELEKRTRTEGVRGIGRWSVMNHSVEERVKGEI